MRYETVLWDLDGTLLNTLTDLACSANYALAQCGLPAATTAQVRAGTGNGVAELLAACTPGGRDCPKFQAVCDAFVAHYDKHSNDHTASYPGVMDLLRQCQAERAAL